MGHYSSWRSWMPRLREREFSFSIWHPHLSHCAIMWCFIVSTASVIENPFRKHHSPQATLDTDRLSDCTTRTPVGFFFSPGEVVLFFPHQCRQAQVRYLILSKLKYFITNHAQTLQYMCACLLAFSYTCAHIQAQTTVKICPSSVSEGFIQPCPRFPRFIIIPFFQSFNLKICSSSFFNNVASKGSMSLGDYAVVSGVSSWLHQRNLIWFGRNPLVPVRYLFRPPRCADFLLCQRGWSWWIWSKREGGSKRLGEWIIIFQWWGTIRNNKS